MRLPRVPGAASAVLAQFLTAGASLLVQVLAARQLGAAGYGSFMLVYGVLLVVLAVQNGWVGDSLTVLERFDPRVRSALVLFQLCFLALGAVACAGSVLVLGLGTGTTALLVAVMAITQLTGELCRRVFMARRAFGALSLNNLVLIAATAASLAVQAGLGYADTLDALVLAVSVGAAAAVAFAVLQLPWAELRPTRPRTAAVREVSSFAVWRAAQLGVRPLALVAVRLVIVAVAGRAVLGAVEAARLLVAPAVTFAQGVGSFLLPTYSAEARGERGQRRLPLRRAVLAVGLVTAVLSALPLVLSDPLTQLLTGGEFDVPVAAVLGWGAFAVAFGVSMPPAIRAVAFRRSRAVFELRALEGVVGVAAAAALAIAGAPELAGLGLAVGGLVCAVLLARLARTPAATGADPAPVPAGAGA